MSWKTHIEELRARERLAEQMGGEERVSRQRSQGKLVGSPGTELEFAL